MCAQLGGAINIEEQVKDFKAGFQILPPGWYKGHVVDSDVLDTKDGTGKRAVLTFRTGGGDDIQESYNIVNKSEVAQKIGRAQLAKIALSCGLKGELTDTKFLHGKPLKFKIEIDEFESNKEKGKMLKSNKIADYAAVNAKVEEVGDSSASADSGSSSEKSSW